MSQAKSMEALLPSRRMTPAKTRDLGFLGIPPKTLPRRNLRSSVLLVTARSSWPEDSKTNCKSFSTPLRAVTAAHRIGLREQIQVKAAAEIQEEQIEKVIYRFRFITLLGVLGSLVGSALCFLKGSLVIASSFIQYFSSSGRVISMLIEAIDVYLIGTVMLVFGMGIYELFISNLDIGKKSPSRSNLLGLFKLQERPKWLEIKSVNELKTKLGHVIVMVLLVGLFEKSKKVVITSPIDLLCFAASILFSSCGLFLLSKLKHQKR